MSEKMKRAAEEKFLQSKTMTGFWLYLMTDCLLFGSLFAAFIVLRSGTAGGPSGADIFELPMVLVETLILLTSSLTIGMALIALRRKNKPHLFSLLGLTFVFGAAFLAIELHEFSVLISEGYSWERSAFLSAFFLLVGTHGLHILFGLIWLAILLVVLVKKGITAKVTRQLAIFGLFWHFLDLVWIFVFTVVYLMGVN